MDIQESREDWAKELSIQKRPRYQGPSVSMAPGSNSNKGFRFNATLQRGEQARGRGSWLRNRYTFQKAQTTSVSHSKILEAPWCQKCKMNYFSKTAFKRALVIIVAEYDI